MRRASHANHTERSARSSSGDGESLANGDACDGNAINDGTGSEGAGAGVEVWRVPDLHVEMIGSAGAAETAASVGHGTVEEKEGNRVIVAGDRSRSHLGEGVGGRIEELGDELGRGVGEGNSGDLTTGGKDGAVGEDNGVGEGASIRHGADGLNGRSRGWGTYRDDVGIGGGVGALVVG